MKKSIILFLSLALLITLSACGKKEEKPAASGPNIQGGLKVNEPNTIMGWLKSGQGVECEVDSPEGGKITVQAMDDKVKISGFPYVDMTDPTAAEKVEGSSLTANGWMYLWGGRSGMKMNMERMRELSEDLSAEQQQNQPKTWEDMAKEWDESGVGYDCKKRRFAPSNFEQPAGVEFSDLTTFMEDMADMGRQLQEQTQAGQGMDLDAMRRQAEEMKAQYGVE